MKIFDITCLLEYKGLLMFLIKLETTLLNELNMSNTEK